MQRRPLIEAPPPAPRMELSQAPDALSEMERLLGVAVGTQEQKGGSIMDAIAAALGVLPIMGMAKKLSGAKKGVQQLVPKGLKVPTPGVPIKHAELPAEFQAVGAEDAYNDLRKMRVQMRLPKPSNEGDWMLRNHVLGEMPDDPIRAAREANEKSGKFTKPKGRN